MPLLIKLLNPKATIPTRAHSNDSGLDLSACLDEDVIIQPKCYGSINSGIAIKLPEPPVEGMTWEAQLRPRSGLAFKYGVTCNFGTIDNQYTGELKLLLFNHGHDSFTVIHGMRIAQLVIQPVALFPIEVVDELVTTERGESGFGSTGI